MKKNIGKVDRIIRLVIAAVLIGLVSAGIMTGREAGWAIGGAAVLAITAFVRFCPLYTLCGASSCKV